jgi:hypothetical protein
MHAKALSQGAAIANRSGSAKFEEVPCATRLLPVLIGSGGTLSPPWSEQPKI